MRSRTAIRNFSIALLPLLATFLHSSSQVSAQGIELSKLDTQQLQSAFAETLKDPESARFRKDLSLVYVSPTNGFGEICMMVNAKNGYGGYAGYKLVFMTFYKQQAEIKNIRVEGFGDRRTSDNCDNVRRQLEKIKHHDPRLTVDQVRAGCSIENDKLFCASPGTGMCWEKGHNPWKGEFPSRAIDVGNGPSSPDFDHSERCDNSR